MGQSPANKGTAPDRITKIDIDRAFMISLLSDLSRRSNDRILLLIFLLSGDLIFSYSATEKRRTIKRRIRRKNVE